MLIGLSAAVGVVLIQNVFLFLRLGTMRLENEQDYQALKSLIRTARHKDKADE